MQSTIKSTFILSIFWDIDFNNSMKHYQQFSMVHRVHKNVRKMLSEAREVIKSRSKIPSLKKHSAFLQEISPIDITRLSANFDLQYGKDSIQRYRKFRARERPYSLMVVDSVQDERLHRTENKSENKMQRKEKDHSQKEKQIKISQFLNKEQAELIDSYRKEKMHKNRQYKTILPQIINQRPKRSSTETTSSYCLTIPIEALEKLTDFKIKQNLAIKVKPQSLSIPLEENKAKKILKKDTQKISKAKIKSNLNILQKYEPWESEQEQNDFFMH